MISDVDGANEEYQRRFADMTEADERKRQQAINDEIDKILSGGFGDGFDDPLTDIFVSSDAVQAAIVEIITVDPRESVTISGAADRASELARLAINLNLAAENAVRDYVERNN